MKGKADTDHGWLKLAHELAEALTRAQLTGTEYAVCMWVMCRTYGIRRTIGRNFVALKFTDFSRHEIAHHTGRDRAGVRRAVEELFSKSVLVTNDEGRIGFNTAILGWRSDVIKGNPMGLWMKAEKPCGQPVDNDYEGGSRVPPRGEPAPPRGGAQSPLGGSRVPPPSYARAGEKQREIGREKTESAPTPGANSSRPQNFCAYKDRGQGQCRDAAEPSSKFCAPHGFKVTEKSLNPRAEGKPEGLVSAADAVKEMGFGQGRTDGRG